MTEPFPSRAWAWCACAVGLVGGVGTAALFAHLARDDASVLVWCTPFLLAFLSGLVAFWLRPDELAARRFLVFGAAAGLFIGSTVGLVHAFEELGRRWWLGPANVGVHVIGLAFEASLIALLAVYPDGRYQRRYERRTVRIAAALVLVLPVLLLVASPSIHPMWAFAWGSGDDSGFPTLASPVHVPALSFLAPVAQTGIDAALALGPLVASVLVVRRYRRIPGRERRRFRWPFYGVLLLVLLPIATVLDEVGVLSTGARDVFVIAGLAVLPLSVAVGLVKPDLFDVDLAARRSLVFVPLWIAIAAAYVGTAAALGLAASGLGVPAVVGVTLLAVAVFEPLRRRSTRRAAKWVYGDPLDGTQLLGWLEQALDEGVDLDEVAGSIAAANNDWMGVRWTRVHIEGQPPVVRGDDSVRAGEPAMTAELAHAGRRFGEIGCGPRVLGGRPDAPDVTALATFARQVAATLHTVRLADELRSSLAEQQRQSAELAASRTRLVEAEESARRRIERDLHDGAQQELVGLAAQIGLARSRYADVGGVEDMLADLQAGLREALDDLRRLAHGIHPTELADHGLVETIEGRSARLPLTVTVACEPSLRTERFGDQVESAAYFFVSEALTNVVKHAAADRARVTIARCGDELTVEVTDYGRGFVSGDGPQRTGLRGLADRVEAVGGSVEVSSAPGHGTTLRARLPVGIPTGGLGD